MNNLLCLLIIISSIIILGMIIYKENSFCKLDKKISAFGIIVILLPVICLINVFAKDNTISKESINEINYITSNNEKIKKIGLNKVIIIGDSRMRMLADDEQINVPSNISFIALGGAKIDWMISEAYPELKKILNNRKENIKYHIVINMGVNDLNVGGNSNDVANNYYKEYNKIAKKYSFAEIYVLSINPVDDNRYRGFVRNKQIRETNNLLKKFIETDNLTNIHYCNSYSTLTFVTKDGIHYDTDTSQKIIDYIKNDCVVYK